MGKNIVTVTVDRLLEVGQGRRLVIRHWRQRRSPCGELEMEPGIRSEGKKFIRLDR